jgi:predicted ATPase
MVRRELSEALDLLTQERLLLLVLEDSHWSDVSTLEWVAYIARRDPARLMILGIYRPVDAAIRAHPLPTVITELLQHDHYAELVLDYLSEAVVADHLCQRLGTKPFPDDRPRVLWQCTNGNPLFLIAVVNTLVSQGILEEPTYHGASRAAMRRWSGASRTVYGCSLSGTSSSCRLQSRLKRISPCWTKCWR